MLARTPVSGRRRIAATAIVLALSASAGLAAWAAQPERTIFEEAPELLVPFNPLPASEQDASAPTTHPHPGADFDPFVLPPDVSEKADGDVVVELCVSVSGAVADVKLARSSGNPALDAATVQQLHAARFEPATRGGQPIEMCGYNLTVGWRLGDRQTGPDPAAAGKP